MIVSDNYQAIHFFLGGIWTRDVVVSSQDSRPIDIELSNDKPIVS